MEEAIERHAVVGDCRSAALIGRSGAVDWLCWPRFDSDPLLAGLLDERRGGTLRVGPAAGAPSTRRYLPGTNVLETRFLAPGGELELVDFMPAAGERAKRSRLSAEHELLRRARCVRGEVDLEVALDAPRSAVVRRGALGLFLAAGKGQACLRSDVRLVETARGARGVARLRAGEIAWTSLSFASEAPGVLPPLGARAEAALEETARWWRAWSARLRFDGPRREAVVRSALALRLLVYAPSGAVIAAPTTSLPERPGGELNWDYRYCWLRDASLTVRAFLGLGLEEEAEAFGAWLAHATPLTHPAVRVLYDVHGGSPSGERVEAGLSGWRGARPVRLGNAAADQVQLDVYGELVDALAQLPSVRAGADGGTRRLLGDLGRWISAHWRDGDHGIWETRGARRPYTLGRVLAWVALDRLLGLHRAGVLPRLDAAALARERAAIRAFVEARAFSPEAGSYLAYPGGDADASLLLVPHFGYLPASHPRVRGTVRHVLAELRAGDALLFRDPRGRRVGEGAFVACGLWASAALAAGAGAPDEAAAWLDGTLAHANDVGLLAEEVDPRTGAALGNFPQGFSHVGVVTAALALARRVAAGEAPAAREAAP